jgi:hypothetical protein
MDDNYCNRRPGETLNNLLLNNHGIPKEMEQLHSIPYDAGIAFARKEIIVGEPMPGILTEARFRYGDSIEMRERFVDGCISEILRHGVSVDSVTGLVVSFTSRRSVG